MRGNGYYGNSMSNNAVRAYEEGRKPFSRITKEDILQHGIDVSISFFRWFVKNYCYTSEWHHSSPKYNMIDFYDIRACCSAFKNADLDKLKSEYTAQLKRQKPDNTIDDKPYYAKIEYTISTYSGRRKHLTNYAIIHKCWAHFYDDYHKSIIKKRTDGKHFYIAKTYNKRPAEISKDVADTILENIGHKQQGLKKRS